MGGDLLERSRDGQEVFLNTLPVRRKSSRSCDCVQTSISSERLRGQAQVGILVPEESVDKGLVPKVEHDLMIAKGLGEDPPST